MEKSNFTRWAAPIAFLAVITIGALVVRAGFQHGKPHHPQTATTTVTSKTTTDKTHVHHVKRTYYTVVSGDTLATIAAKKGTTVANLMKLNPGINPSALRIGQKIRVQ